MLFILTSVFFLYFTNEMTQSTNENFQSVCTSTNEFLLRNKFFYHSTTMNNGLGKANYYACSSTVIKIASIAR